MSSLKTLLVVALLALSACAHSIHQVHVSDFLPAAPIESGDVVKGYGEQFVILGFVGQTDYVNQAYNQLQTACPRGTISGITTQHSTSLGFLSWTNKVLMQGLCIKARN